MTINKDRIVALLCEQADGRDPATVKEDMTLDDLGLDSLDHLELVMAFEEEMAIEIPDDDADAHFSYGKPIQGIVDYLLSKNP